MGWQGLDKKKKKQAAFVTITFSAFSKSLHKVRWKDQTKHHFGSNGDWETARLQNSHCNKKTLLCDSWQLHPTGEDAKDAMV